MVEETGVHGENHWTVTSHWQTWLHNVALSTLHHEQGSNSQNLTKPITKSFDIQDEYLIIKGMLL
jgi:hypothetical protein